MPNCFPKKAIVAWGGGEMGIVNRANGARQFTRKQGRQHRAVILMKFGPECCQLINRITD
jgi:hypothetical protein